MLKAPVLVYLSALSPKDIRWDNRKAENQAIQELYRDSKYHVYFARLGSCSERLIFTFKVGEDGIKKLTLQIAKFCRVPMCPVCLARRSMKWHAKSIKILPHLMEAHPKSRFILLTLTVRNCHVSELRATLKEMHHAWRKLTQRKEWTVQGFIRTTEVTREQAKDGQFTDYVHPHYHCLLMVKPGYFSNGYVSQERWAEIWESCLGVNYTPVVDVRAIRPPKSLSAEDRRAVVMSAVLEVIKYVTKPSDLIRGSSDGQSMDQQSWLVELTTQLHKVNKIATGGVLKEYFKILEQEPDDLIHIDEDGETESDPDSPRVTFDWERQVKRYAMNKDEDM